MKEKESFSFGGLDDLLSTSYNIVDLSISFWSNISSMISIHGKFAQLVSIELQINDVVPSWTRLFDSIQLYICIYLC